MGDDDLCYMVQRRANRGLEPTGRALEPAGRALEPAGRVLSKLRWPQSQLGGPWSLLRGPEVSWEGQLRGRGGGTEKKERTERYWYVVVL